MKASSPLAGDALRTMAGNYVGGPRISCRLRTRRHSRRHFWTRQP